MNEAAVVSADLDPDALVETVDDEELGHGGPVEAQWGPVRRLRRASTA
jgi:hypothetical protein